MRDYAEKHDRQKKRIMECAIELGATLGIENVTTKRISQSSGLAELYIYRYFESKDNLLKQCFLAMDQETGEYLENVIREQRRRNEGSDVPAEDMLRTVWEAYWKYLTENPLKTEFYQRFFHGGYCSEELRKMHSAQYHAIEKLLDRIRRTMTRQSMTQHSEKECNSRLLTIHLTDMTRDYAARVIGGDLPDDEATINRIQEMILPAVLRCLSGDK